MAREFGRILSAIWADRDFLALGQEEQRFYMFLLSQPNLNQAGVLPVTVRRWSSAASDLSAVGVERLLTELDRERFVVWDHNTEELLIRTFVRNDKVYRQPKVMLAMVSDAAEIVSLRLRMALLAELDRIPLDEVSSTPPPKGGPSARQIVDGCMETLRRTLFVPDYTPDPPRQETHAGRVRETLSGTHADTAAEGHPDPSGEAQHGRIEVSNALAPVDNYETAGQDADGKGIGNPSGNPHAGAGAHSPALAPAPAPAYLSLNSASQLPLPSLVESEPLAPLAEKLPNFEDFWTSWPRKVGKAAAQKAWTKAVGKQRANPVAIVDACRSYAERCCLTGQDPTYIPHASTWLNRGSWDDDLDAVIPLGPGMAPTTAPPMPPHCGHCDPANRWIELPDGSYDRCPDCNPDAIRSRT